METNKKSADINTIHVVDAIYSEQLVPEYSGNPLIEALPPILSFEQAEELLHVYPSYNPKERLLDAHYRFHYVQRLFSYFQPWDKHFDLEQRISRAVRQGYISRNPINPNYATGLQQIYKMIKAGNYEFNNYEFAQTTASGFTVIGFSGVGKTKAIERVLSIYPQVINHTSYKGDPLCHNQIVWLKLECPHDGSVKGLCANFFMDIDRLLGEQTYKKFASGRNTTTDTMIPRMAQIAKRQSLGLLIIDEIQHLSTAKSGGSEKMLNFFVTLVNKIGIPVILIGTTKAMSILQSEFRQARRGSGQQGDMIWENLNKDDTWELLIEGLWDYQWTKKEVPLTKVLKDALYEESQGIVDIAVKLYAMAQMRAIATGTETITPELIGKIAKDNLHLVRPMLLALKSGNKEKIAQYKDIVPIDLDAFITEHQNILSLNEKIREKKSTINKKDEINYDVLGDAVLKLLDLGVEASKAKRVINKAMNEKGELKDSSEIVKAAYRLIMFEEFSKEAKPKKKSQSGTKKTDNKDLRSIIEEGRKQKLSAYDSFKLGGLIRNPVEEFIAIG